MTRTIILPSSRIMQRFRKEISHKRVSPAVGLYVTAAIEKLVQEIIESAAQEAKSNKKKKITRECLMTIVRTYPGIKRLFINFAFAPMAAIKYNAADFLTKSDREKTATSKKESVSKKSKQKQKDPPEVDEDDDNDDQEEEQADGN